MPDSIRTLYQSVDPDYGTLVLGFFQEVPFYAAVLSTALTTPLATSNILLYDPPGDMNGSDYIEESVEATAGNTTADEIDETFTFAQTKAISFGGLVTAQVNVTIDLDQVDGTTGGAARLNTILVELLKYKISDGTTTQLGILTNTINKDVAGISVIPAYAEQTLTEMVYFNLGVDPKIEVGQTLGYLLQMRVKVNFSAYTPAAASTTTIAKCRLNCYRDLSKNTLLRVPVI